MKSFIHSLSLAGFLLSTEAPLASESNGKFFVTGPGATTCKSFSNAYAVAQIPPASKSDEDVVKYSISTVPVSIYLSWITGFISAFNELAPHTYSIAGKTSNEEILSYVNEYCLQHQKDDVWQATNSLITWLSESQTIRPEPTKPPIKPKTAK